MQVEGEGSGQPFEPQLPSSTAPPSQVTTVASQHQKTQKPKRAKRGQDTEIPQSSGPPKNVGDEAVYTGEDDRWCADAQTRFETASKKSHDPPLSEGNTSGSGEDSMEHPVDLTDFVPPTPYDSPLSGEFLSWKTKILNTLVIQKLKKRVKRLEKALRARTPGMKLFKIGTSRRKGLDKENVSKQGRKSDKIKPMFNDSDFDVLDDAMENVKGGSTAKQITTAGDTLNTASINVSDVGPSHVSTTGPSNVSDDGPSTSIAGDIFEDEMTTIADTLMAIRSARPRTTLVMIHNVEEEPRRATPVPTKGRSSLLHEELNRNRNSHHQSSLRNKRKLYEKEQKWINDFVPFPIWILNVKDRGKRMVIVKSSRSIRRAKSRNDEESESETNEDEAEKRRA
ncbi:hypothetical protein Tco_0237413 [Tanacetum coccineum]